MSGSRFGGELSWPKGQENCNQSRLWVQEAGEMGWCTQELSAPQTPGGLLTEALTLEEMLPPVAFRQVLCRVVIFDPGSLSIYY